MPVWPESRDLLCSVETIFRGSVVPFLHAFFVFDYLDWITLSREKNHSCSIDGSSFVS